MTIEQADSQVQTEYGEAGLRAMFSKYFNKSSEGRTDEELIEWGIEFGYLTEDD